MYEKKSLKNIAVSVTLIFMVLVMFGSSLILPLNVSAASSTLHTRKFDQSASKDSELKEAGCGLFATGNAIYAFTGQTIDIAALKKWAVNNGTWTASGGLYRDNFFKKLATSDFAKKYNFTVTAPVRGTIASSDKKIAKTVQKGNVAVIIGVPNHFMCITDYDSKTNKYFVIESYASGANYRNLPGASWVTESKLSEGKTKVTTYTFLTFGTTPYEKISKGTYFLKNVSSGTYLSVDGAKVSNGQNLSVAAKKDANAFKFYTDGGVDNFFYSLIDKNYVVNPYAESAKAGTNMTLYKKDPNGNQVLNFQKAGGGYVMTLKSNPDLAVSLNGSNVQLAALNTSDKKQQWILETPTIPVTTTTTVTKATTTTTKAVVTTTTTKAATTTTAAATTTTKSEIATTTVPETDILYGDANNDKKVDISDAVIIMQFICNPSRYGIEGTDPSRLTAEGAINADCSNPGDGITNADALAIQKYSLSLIKTLPETK